MGAFFLSAKGETVRDSDVRRVFSAKGFGPPGEFTLGAGRLWLFGKQLVDERNYSSLENGDALFAVGTPVYRGLAYAEGLGRLLLDFVDGQLDHSELLGSFCLLFWVGGHLRLVTDSANLYHVFADEAGTVISNSLQAVLVSDGRRHEVNTFALLEQLLTGAIAGPDTCFSDIILLNRAEQTGFRSRMCQFVTPAVPQGAVSAELAFRDEVDRQVEVLRKYFQSIRATAEAHGIDIGLSGGYDSRLLLLLASESGVPISAHTFAGLAHLLEREIAGELARLTHVELRPVPVRLLEDKDGCEADANIDDALHYYDGRTNMTMGTFNDVHTRAARLTALGARRLGLNGLGGELYRNREHLRRGAINFREWMQYYAFDPAAAAAVKDRKLRGALVEKLGRKYAGLIGVDAGERFDREVARRYYRDVWLPYSAGPKNCAENQLAYFLMPFADPSVTSHSIRINRNLGLAGRFEGAMIRRLSTTVADVPSSYGGGFGRDPVTVSLRAWFHAAVPVWARNLHGRRHAQRSTRRAGSFEIWLPRNDRLLAGLELLRAFGLPLDWGVLLADRVHRDRALFVGQFLHAFRDHVADTRRPVLN